LRLGHLPLRVVRSNCPPTLTSLPPAHHRPPAAAAPSLSVLQTMRERGWMRYSTAEEADITAERVAVVPEEVDRQRVRFQQVRRRACLRCVPGCHVMSDWVKGVVCRLWPLAGCGIMVPAAMMPALPAAGRRMQPAGRAGACRCRWVGGGAGGWVVGGWGNWMGAPVLALITEEHGK
jgi:hypothetical protein